MHSPLGSSDLMEKQVLIIEMVLPCLLIMVNCLIQTEILNKHTILMQVIYQMLP